MVATPIRAMAIRRTEESCGRERREAEMQSALVFVQIVSREPLRTVCETEYLSGPNPPPWSPPAPINAELAARLSDQPSSTRHRPINIGCQTQIGWSGYRRTGSIKDVDSLRGCEPL